MGIYENLPYTNFHEINVGWVIRRLKRLENKMKDLHEPDEIYISKDLEMDAEFSALAGMSEEAIKKLQFNWNGRRSVGVDVTTSPSTGAVTLISPKFITEMVQGDDYFTIRLTTLAIRSNQIVTVVTTSDLAYAEE